MTRSSARGFGFDANRLRGDADYYRATIVERVSGDACTAARVAAKALDDYARELVAMVNALESEDA